MIVDAYAVGVHGRPRATKDLDVWVEATAANAPKVITALREFGAPLMGLTESDLHVGVARSAARQDVPTLMRYSRLSSPSGCTE